ncbi:MAG: hypothetical protein ACUVXI_03995 [bacterium]
MRGQTSIAMSILGVDVEIDFELDPGVEGWEEGAGGSFASKDYNLEMVERKSEENTVALYFTLRRKDGREFAVKRNTIKFRMPMVGIYKIWPMSSLSSRRFMTDLPWRVESRSCANTHQPLVLAVNSDGTNSFTVGLANQKWDTKITGGWSRFDKPGHQNYVCKIAMERLFADGIEIRTDSYNDAIYISNKHVSWYDSVSDYTDFVDGERGYVPREMPEHAMEPMWHSWYAFEAEIDQDRILEQAKIANGLGIKTIMIDAGWNNATDWGASYEIASATPNRAKFPEFENMVKEIQSGGQYVMVRWVPFHLAGEMDQRLLYRTQRSSLEAYPCPRNPEVVENIVRAAERLFREYGLDGLWYDTVDGISFESACIADHEHQFDTVGEGMDAILQKVTERILEINPKPILIFRRSHANTNNKPYLTHLWPGDSPFDYDMNRREVVVMKSYSKGVLTHACCTCWSPMERDEVVAKHLASVSLAGVPSISVDLKSIPPSHIELIEKWFAFYHRHKRDIMCGEFKPLVLTFPSAAIRIESNEKAFVGYFDVIPGTTELTRQFKEIYLVNCNSEELRTTLTEQKGEFQMEVLDYRFKQIQTGRVKAKGNQANLEVSAPFPNIVQLSRIA